MLIDNSTLSGVERILGLSQTLNLSNTGNDILCFERLVTAILFSEKLLGIDDYKDTYRSKRLKNFEYVQFIEKRDISYEEYSVSAADFAKQMLFSFEGSKPAGDAVKFFEALQVDPQMRWNVWTSSEYLTLSYLVNDTRSAFKEETVTAALSNELTDKSNVGPLTAVYPGLATEYSALDDIKQLIDCFAKDNDNFSGPGTGSVLEKMVFGYGWLAERCKFYSLVSSSLNCDMSLSPLREAFCESCLRIDYPAQIPALIETLKRNTKDTVASIVEHSGTARFVTRLPFFTSFFISVAPTPSEAILLALEHRTDPNIVACRDLISNLSHLKTRDRYGEVNRIMGHLERSLLKLRKKYGVIGSQGESYSISVGVTGPEISKGFTISSLIPDLRHQPFAKVFRNMAQDMLNVERLGSLYEKMLTQRKVRDDAMWPKVSLTPTYMATRSSEYGRPASSNKKY